MNFRVGPPLWACALLQAVLLAGLWVVLAALTGPRLAMITLLFISALAIAAISIGVHYYQPKALAMGFTALMCAGIAANVEIAVRFPIAEYLKLVQSLSGAEQIMINGTIAIIPACIFWILCAAVASIGKLLPQGWRTPLWGDVAPQKPKVMPLRRRSGW